MFAVDHAATALLLKRRYPTVPLAPLLLSVQAMELAWVLLNFLGVERTTTEPVVRKAWPTSTSPTCPILTRWPPDSAPPLLAWLVLEFGAGSPLLGRAVGLGNLANISLFSTAIPGPESLLAGRPLLVGSFVFVQIVVTLILVGLLSRRLPVATR